MPRFTVEVDESVDAYEALRRIHAMAARHDLQVAYEPIAPVFSEELGWSPYTWRMKVIEVTVTGQQPVIAVAVESAGELLEATREVYREMAVHGL